MKVNLKDLENWYDNLRVQRSNLHTLYEKKEYRVLNEVLNFLEKTIKDLEIREECIIEIKTKRIPKKKVKKGSLAEIGYLPRVRFHTTHQIP